MKVSNSGTRGIMGPNNKGAVDQPAGAAPKQGSRKDGKVADGFEKSQAPNRMEQLQDSTRARGSSPSHSPDPPPREDLNRRHGSSAPESNKVGSTDPGVKREVEAQLYSTKLGSGIPAKAPQPAAGERLTPDLFSLGPDGNLAIRNGLSVTPPGPANAPDDGDKIARTLGERGAEKKAVDNPERGIWMQAATPSVKGEVEAFVRDTKLGSGTPAKAPQPAAGDRLTPDLFSLNPDGSLAIRNGLSVTPPGPTNAPDDGGKVARTPDERSTEKTAIDVAERGYLR